MMLKFTNASGAYKGNPLWINSEWIVSVFEEATDGGSVNTVIYGGPTGIPWYIEESLNEAIAIISNKAH